MNTERLSGIVVYTIHDNELRNELRNALENIGAESLDQSTFGIAIQGELPDNTINKLTSVCRVAVDKSRKTFDKKDFVTLYRLSYSENTSNDRYIIQTKII